jgi:hypothetical protein
VRRFEVPLLPRAGVCLSSGQATNRRNRTGAQPCITSSLLVMVVNHPASFHETKKRSETLRAKLEAQLPDQQVEAAQTRAIAKTFEAAVEEILHQASLGHYQMVD